MPHSTRSRFLAAMLLLLSFFVMPSARAQDAGAEPQVRANADSKASDATRIPMPDLSGTWIFSVRVPLPKGAPLREINGDSLTFVVSRSREPGCDFEFREKQNARSPKMRVKWLPGTRRFQTVVSEATTSPEAALELSADGKLLRMQAALEPVEKKRLAEQLGIDEGDVERAFHQEFRREEPSHVAAAPQDKPSNSKPLSPAEMLIQSGLGSFNPQAQPTDLTKPVQINLQPATQLAKLLVERFADRGAKVLEYEEGKRLKVEAPPAVLVQVGDLLGKVFQEPELPATANSDNPLPQVEMTVPGQPTFKIPDISGVWAYKTPDLPLTRTDDDGTEAKVGKIAITQQYLVQRAANSTSDFTLKDITIVALPGAAPQPLAKRDVPPSRLRWNKQTQKFDALNDKGEPGGMTLELLDVGRLKMASNVSAAERKRLAQEGGVSEATMEQLLHQTWVRVPLDKLDEATRKLVEAASAGQPQPRHPVPHSDQQPRPGDWDRYFVVQRSADQNETGSGERTKRFTVHVLPESPAIGFVKPGDRVDLYLPDFERLVVINANETYVQPKQRMATSVPVATFTEYLHGELQMTVLLTAAEESRIKSNPTWHDIGKMTITHVVRLKHASADHVVELIRQSFPFGVRDDDSAQNSLVSCESDLKQNAVILKEQPVFTEKPLSLIDVETAIRKLDAPVDGKVGEAKSVRVLPDTPAAKQLVEQRSAEAGMPDITGTWGPYGIDEAIIRRTENGNADFEMSFQLRKQYVRQENDTDPPPLLLKWVPESQYFQTVDQTVDAVGRRRKTFSLKPHSDGKSMEVCSLQANPHPSDFFLMLKIKSDTQTSLATADDSQSGIYIEDFKLTNASADKLGQKLNVLFPNAMIAAYVRTNHIVAAADRMQLEFIGNVVNAEDADAEKVFSVTNGSAVEYAKILTALNPDLKVTADEQTNSIAVTADKERMKFVEALLLKLDHAATKPAQSKSDLNRGGSIHGAPIGLPGPPHLPHGVRALPDTPAAKQLVDQLTAQESAAAATAATIRQLQSNGQVEQNKTAIAEHQRKLKNLLSTAFDLKLQLEELQVKELQARLSQLERQIGQRKELREKIINRRATELIEGDALMWSSSDRPTVKTAPSSTLTATVLTTPPPTTNREEPTFDGVPYSQWVKLLESERKPDKLIKAMEACGTLATVGDERRIARGLLAAANRYEDADSSNERNNVWNAATKVLKQLSGEAVIREMLAVSNDEQVLGRHDFTSRFLVIAASSSRAAVSDRLRAAFKQHDRELVTLLLKKSQAVAPSEASANGSVMDDRSRRLLGAAVSVWLISERKLSHFADLQPLVILAIEEVYLPKPGRSQQVNEPWRNAAAQLAEQEPETPGLALMLSKHIAKDRQPIFGWLTQMGPHAEPAVPALIEAFLGHWKKRENRMRGTDTSNENDGIWPHSEEERMVQVLDVLGAIGPKAKSAAPLLRQIAVTASAKRAGQPESLNDKLFDAVKRTLARIRDDSAAEPVESPTLLSDFARLQGVWTVTSLTPQADHKDIQFEFDGGLSIRDKHLPDNFEVVRKVMSHLGLNSSGMDCRINDTVTPRQIEFTNMRQPHRQLGIYELQGSRLKIELAKPGLPFPKEFSSDPNKLPEGHVSVELHRDGEPKPPAASPIKAAVLPTPEELKAKLKPFADPVKAAMQRVRDLEPTFFKDRSNFKEMQQALHQLAQAHAAGKPQLKVIEAVSEVLNTEYQLAGLTAKALENRHTEIAQTLWHTSAHESELATDYRSRAGDCDEVRGEFRDSATSLVSLF